MLSSMHIPARRRAVWTVVSSAVCIFLAHDAKAATARVRWLPRGDAARYDVYVRDAGATHAASPAWSGKPPPGEDGALEAIVSFAPADSGANYFAVVAFDGAAESPLSDEVPVGTPLQCRADHCITKTSCDFTPLPDGTSCDSGAGDPCLAACLAGTCAIDANAAAADVAIKRLKLTTRPSGTKVVLKGSFSTEDAVDPTSSGAIVELRAFDGTVVYSAAIAAESFTAKGQRFHFGASRSAPDPVWNGLGRLDLRRAKDAWIVTAQGRSPDLASAALEPALTLVVRLGATCARRLDVPCEQKATISDCR